jgi:hypothetical protein
MNKEMSAENVVWSLKFFKDLTKLSIDAIAAVKSKNIWGLVKLMPEFKLVILDAEKSLPELSHLSPSDALAIGAAAYECLKAIVAAAHS